MEKWNGDTADGIGIVLDGKGFYSMKRLEGGYGPYQVWSGSKVVAIITKTQHQYMNDCGFWTKRYHQQLDYITQLADRHFEWSGRRQQLLISAMEMLDVIKNRLP